MNEKSKIYKFRCAIKYKFKEYINTNTVYNLSVGFGVQDEPIQIIDGEVENYIMTIQNYKTADYYINHTDNGK